MSFVLKQETFEGPLDLLLQLIEAEELDITTISLAQVTDEYLAYVEELEQRDLPEISDWLVIAARLILLKSRALLPVETEDEEAEDDLAAQLAEYKKFKDRAAALGERFTENRFSIGKSPLKFEPPEGIVMDGVTVPELQRAFDELLAELPEPRPVRTETLDAQLTIDECIDSVKSLLTAGPKEFKVLFTKLQSRVAMIVTFLAVLELVKQRLLSVSRDGSALMVGLRA